MQIVKIIYTMFAWPQGIVVGNLIASAMTSVAVSVWHHVRLKRMEDRYQIVIQKLTEKLESLGNSD